MKKFNEFINEKPVNELFIKGGGGQLDENSTNLDKVKYSIQELAFLKERFEMNMDKITEKVATEIVEKLSSAVNDIHDIINNL